ncbi:MAG: SBBP repeat-containing protein [Bryobacteraceae bacterium]
MHRFLGFLSAAAFLQTLWPASPAVSTFLKDGFTPSAIAADAQGNVYVAGSSVIDPKAQTTSAMVAKVDGKVSQYLYLTYFDSAASDQISAMTVDSAGNAYIAGWTGNSNFPVTGGGTLGTAPKSSSDLRSFVAKLNPQGAVMFAVLIGGSVSSTARGIAVTPQGQILVSGTANASGFPVTGGAYSVADSTNHWFLMELDPTASKTILSATGIGGSSIVVDASGNIYLAGSSTGTDYPTTAGAYQTTFVQGYTCSFLCQLGFPGGLQHVTKVDSAASKLIYSTGLNDIKGSAGSTTNTGLAVDAVGNAYVTGTLAEASYPFTVPPPQIYTGYLSKLDPAGANLLFSIPFGGAGVQLDSAGAVYAGGTATSATQLFSPGPNPPPGLPSVFSWLPEACLPNNITAISAAYEIKVDPATGNIVDGQWIDGSATSATGIVLAAGKVWVTGTAVAPDVPFSPGVLAPFAPLSLGPGFLQGGWLAAADFSTGPNGGPAIACVLDSGNLTHVGGVTGFQLISIFGANLGPAIGVAAPGGTDTSVAGVSATFDGDNPAQLLYASATQINLAVPLPLPSRTVAAWPTATVMQLNVNGATISRQFPYLLTNLNLFANLMAGQSSCGGASPGNQGYQPVATNADGTLNSCANPAPAGSTVSFYMHGIGASQLGFPPVAQIGDLTATVGYCSALVTGAVLIGDFVYQVDVTMPASPSACTGQPGATPKYQFPVVFNYSGAIVNGAIVGPFVVPGPGPLSLNFAPGEPMTMMVYVTQ